MFRRMVRLPPEVQHRRRLLDSRHSRRLHHCCFPVRLSLFSFSFSSSSFWKMMMLLLLQCHCPAAQEVAPKGDIVAPTWQRARRVPSCCHHVVPRLFLVGQSWTIADKTDNRYCANRPFRTGFVAVVAPGPWFCPMGLVGCSTSMPLS